MTLQLEEINIERVRRNLDEDIDRYVQNDRADPMDPVYLQHRLSILTEASLAQGISVPDALKYVDEVLARLNAVEIHWMQGAEWSAFLAKGLYLIEEQKADLEGKPKPDWNYAERARQMRHQAWLRYRTEPSAEQSSAPETFSI